MTPTRFAAGVVIVLAFIGALLLADWLVSHIAQLIGGC